MRNVNGVQMSIRTATPDDGPRVAGLLRELGYPDNDEAEVRHRLRDWDADQNGAVLVAEMGGVVVGVVAVATVPYLERAGRWGRIVAIVTDPRWRGEGVGRGLMAAAEQLARHLGCRQMEVTSANSRVGAHTFYRRLGYDDWANRSGRFLKDLVPGFSSGSYAARFPGEPQR